MIVAVVALAVLVLVLLANRQVLSLASETLAHSSRVEDSLRQERETLMRALLARNVPEFATLERIETARVAAHQGNSPAAQRDREAYQRDLESQLREMGLDPADVPPVPEGS